MELLVWMMLVVEVAWGRQEAVSYQNFRAGHGQGHPTYGADGSWSQHFGGNHRTVSHFPAFSSSAQSFVHRPRSFFSSGTHLHTSGPPPPPRVTSFQSQISYEPQNIPGNQNLVNGVSPHLYQPPTVSSFRQDFAHSSLPPQSYGTNRLPQFADTGNVNYDEGISTIPPAHAEPQNYPVNNPIETFDSTGNEEYPGNEGPPNLVYNAFVEGHRIESPPSYSSDQSKPTYQSQSNENSYGSEGNFYNFDEPKGDFPPPNDEPILQTPGSYNAPITDVRNNDRPISDVRTLNESPIPGQKNKGSPITDLKTHSDRPSDWRNIDEGPSPDFRIHKDKSHTDFSSGNGRPGSDLRAEDRPVSQLRSNYDKLSSEIKNNNDRHTTNIRLDNDKPLTDFRHENNRAHFGSSKTNLGPSGIYPKSGPQAVTNKQFKPVLTSSSPLKPQNTDFNSRITSGPVRSSLSSAGSKPFIGDERKPVGNQSFGQKDSTKSDFTEEDKSQSFESDFQSSEIGGQSFETDVPDFGSDESFFNSQEGYGSFDSGGKGSFESSGEGKRNYERPGFNLREEKRNNLKSDRTPDFQSSITLKRRPIDGPAEPRKNEKLRSDLEARHRIDDDKKISNEDKKIPFPVIGDKNPTWRGDSVTDKGYPMPRSASTAAPAKDTFNKKIPSLTPLGASSYTGEKFVPFAPIEKTFPHRGRRSSSPQPTLTFQIQAPSSRVSHAMGELSDSTSPVARNVPALMK